MDKSRPMDAAEKLMLDLMDKHPGASEGSHPLFQNVGRNKPDVLRGSSSKRVPPNCQRTVSTMPPFKASLSLQPSVSP
jgi:hypothetical protein